MSAAESPTHCWHGPVTHAGAFPGYDRIGEEAGGAELQIRRRLARMIHARGLGRRFGDKRVLTDVDVEVGAGELLLVTGPNGSGKTTLLRLLAGLIVPTSGELEVAVDRARIGFLGHEPLLYRELTPLENLDLYGRLYRIPERRERIGMLLERFGLWEARREQTGAFSRGMLQRLALCRALLHEPDLLLLDEPFSALDAGGTELLLDELRRVSSRTVVVASHLPERLGPTPTARLALGLT
jgi:heme exporter protein A